MGRPKRSFFSPDKIQERVEAKLNRYINAIQDDKLKVLLSNAPQNQETLDMLEREFAKVILDVEGEDDKEKWSKVSQGTKAAQEILSKQRESLENDE